MPRPDNIEMEAIFELYEVHDKKIEKKTAPQAPNNAETSSYWSFFTTVGMKAMEGVTSTVATVGNFLKNMATYEKELDKICCEIKQKIDNHRSTPEKDIALVFFFYEQAEKAQNAKWWPGQSRCCRISCALADYVKQCLRSKDYPEGQKIYHSTLSNLVLERETSFLELKARAMPNNQGAGVVQTQKNFKNVVKQIAYLMMLEIDYNNFGENYIEEATRYDDILNHLEKVPKIEEEFKIHSSCHNSYHQYCPYLLQPNTLNLVYDDFYHKLEGLALDKYLEKKKKEILTRKRIIPSENLSTNLNNRPADAGAGSDSTLTTNTQVRAGGTPSQVGLLKSNATNENNKEEEKNEKKDEKRKAPGKG